MYNSCSPLAEEKLQMLRDTDSMNVTVVHPQHSLGVRLDFRGPSTENPLNFHTPQTLQEFWQTIRPLVAVYNSVECTHHIAHLSAATRQNIRTVAEAPSCDVLHLHDHEFSPELEGIIFTKTAGVRPDTVSARLTDCITHIRENISAYVNIAYASGLGLISIPASYNLVSADWSAYVSSYFTEMSEDIMPALSAGTVSNETKMQLSRLLFSGHIGVERLLDQLRDPNNREIRSTTLGLQEKLEEENKLVRCRWPETSQDHTFVCNAFPGLHGRESTELPTRSSKRNAILWALPVLASQEQK